MSVDETLHRSIDEPTRIKLFITVAMVIALLFVLASVIPKRGAPDKPIPGVAEPCDWPACVSPRQIIGTNEAMLMKRRLGNHVLVVDIRSTTEPPVWLPVRRDVAAPFMEPAGDAALEFRLDFGDKVDDALRAAHMKHTEPVILVSPSVERSVLAALLLQERGYTGILVMDDLARAKMEAPARAPETSGETRIPLA